MHGMDTEQEIRKLLEQPEQLSDEQLVWLQPALDRLSLYIKQRQAVVSSIVKRIAEERFPNREEGTNRAETTSLKLSCTQKVYRTVDRATVDVVVEELNRLRAERQEPPIPRDTIVRWKPELEKKTYNQLTPDDQIVFDQCLKVSDAKPEIKIFPKAAAVDGNQ